MGRIALEDITYDSIPTGPVKGSCKYSGKLFCYNCGSSTGPFYCVMRSSQAIADTCGFFCMGCPHRPSEPFASSHFYNKLPHPWVNVYYDRETDQYQLRWATTP